MTNTRLLTIAQRAASSLETLQASYDLARLAIQNGIPGDFVECGVFMGAQCAAMALAIMDMGEMFFTRRVGNELVTTKPRVHLFDSFEGVQEPGEHDHQWREAGHPPGTSAHTAEQVAEHMAEWGIDPELLVYHPGDVAETVASMMQTPISILRIDVDLYEPTLVCLEHLYPLLSKGGWLIADDFGLDGARKAFMDYFSRKDGYGFNQTYFHKQH